MSVFCRASAETVRVCRPGESHRRNAVVLQVTIAVVLLPAASALAQDRTPARAVVSGVVYDSIARHTIAGAAVEFVNADDPSARPHTTVSDASGRYTLGDVPHGTYLAGFFHGALDTLGLEGAPRRITVTGSSARVDLATPSPKTIARSICAGEVLSDSTGLLLGHVRTTDEQSPVSGASVVVEWSETVIDAQGVRQRTRRANARTAEPGWFALCGLPSDAGMQARAFHASDSSGFVDIDVPANGLRHVSFLVGGATRVTVPLVDTTAATSSEGVTALRGGARLRGTVLDHNRRPLSGAHALIWGTQLETVTNTGGEFSLEGLPGGTHTLEIRAIGYAPQTSTVQLAATRPASATVVLGKPAQVLSTVTVRGTLLYSRRLADFERRRRAGFGTFITSEEIARRPTAKLSQLLQAVPGVRVESFPGSYRVTMQRGATTGVGRAACVPSLFVDGVLDRIKDFDAYFADYIAGIEVYRGEAGRPFEFIDSSNPCGAIAIWTRDIPAKVKKPE